MSALKMLCAAVVSAAFLLLPEAVQPPVLEGFHFVTAPARIEVSALLSTGWHQHGIFPTANPSCSTNPTRHEPLGCNSVAVAQIMYYHRRQPSGSQTYGDTSVKFSHKFDWDAIEAFSADMSRYVEGSYEADETALFCYDTAVVVKKKFPAAWDCDADPLGYETSRNKQAKEIADHFGCKTEIRDVIPNLVLAGTTNIMAMREMEDFIAAELEAGRPLFFISEGWQPKAMSGLPGLPGITVRVDAGHATVIDGYGYGWELVRSFWVHVNFGWQDGVGTGWYKLWSNIVVDDLTLGTNASGDPTRRWVCAIRPWNPVI